MYSSRLLLIFLVYFIAYIEGQILTKPKGCYKDGRYYPEGREFHPIPCRHCVCRNSSIVCDMVQCEEPLCVDPVHEPGKCCQTCPNGRNCIANGQVIPTGGKVYTDDHTVCLCPDTFADESDMFTATCYNTVDSSPVKVVLGKK